MTASSEAARRALAEECPLDWTVVFSEPGLLDIRAPELAMPHGLTLHVEYGTYVSSCTIKFDAFAGPVAAAVRRSFTAFLSDGAERCSSNGWELRVSANLRETPDAIGALESADQEGAVVGSVPAHVLDVLSAAGRIIATAVLEHVTVRVPEQDENLEVGFPEGSRATIQVNRYERDPRNRARALLAHGADCAVCGMNFGRVYGPLAEGYIHVHHIVPVSQLGAGYVVDPVADLVPLCANCHAAAHRRNPPLTVDELRGLIRDSPD